MCQRIAARVHVHSSVRRLGHRVFKSLYYQFRTWRVLFRRGIVKSLTIYVIKSTKLLNFERDDFKRARAFYQEAVSSCVVDLKSDRFLNILQCRFECMLFKICIIFTNDAFPLWCSKYPAHFEYSLPFRAKHTYRGSLKRHMQSVLLKVSQIAPAKYVR